MTNNLIKLANHLDSIGLHKEADRIDEIIKEANPLILGAALIATLCWSGGCVQLTEAEAESMWNELDFNFTYDEPPEGEEAWAIDVNPVCNSNLNDHSCATKEKTETDITITWECDDYKFLRNLKYYEAQTTGTYSVKVQWKLSDGFVWGRDYLYIDDEFPRSDVRSCVIYD